MPGQRGSETRQRNKVLPTRWSDAEYAKLNDIAEASGCTMADVLRRLVAHDHTSIIPTQALVSEISRVGNNLNQITRTLNNLGAREGLPTHWDGVLRQLTTEGRALQSIHRDMLDILARMQAWR